MYVDAQNRPSNDQSVAGSGTIVSTDSIDLLSANDNPGRSGNLRAHSVMTTALAGATSIKAQFVQSANANLSSPDVLVEGPVVALADAVAGAVLMDKPMPDSDKQYIGFQYVLVGTATGGTVSSHIVAGTNRRSNEVAMNTGR